MSNYDTNKIYIQYCEDILNGNIPACQDIILACKKFKEWFDLDDRYFDYEDVDRRIRLVSKMKHWAGKSKDKPFILLPYQQWIFAGIFGWKWKETELRIIRKALLFISRKNGKSSLAAAIAIAQILLDNNNGQEIACVANSGQQARILFDMIKNYSESLDPKGLIFSRYRDSIKVDTMKSTIKVLNSDAMTQDGGGYSLFIEDEFAAARTWDIWNVLVSGQGFQTQPLGIAITSANFLLDSFPAFEWVKICKDILRGIKEDDTTFSALYSLDDGDDWTDESVWKKANPSLDETVTKSYLQEQVITAKNNPMQEFNVKTKNMNVFCQSNATWLQNTIIKEAMQPIDIQSFGIKEYVWAGLDLSTTKDLTSFSIMWKPNPKRSIYPDKYIFKTWCFVSELGMEQSVNKLLYKNWIDNGYLVLIPGNVIDYDVILDFIVSQKDYVRYDTVGYDKFNASQLIINLEKKGVVTQPFSQALGAFNKPTKDFERLILSGQVILDYNPVVLWSFNNVMLVMDKFDNIKPDKPTRDAKIDPVITIIQSLGTYIYTQGAFGADSEIYTKND